MKRHMTWALLGTAVAIAALAANPATAQVRATDNPGGALDANPRVGSGGRNDGLDTRLPTGVGYSTIPGNDIVTGNVTGLGYFHGGVPYAGSRDFRGNLGSASVDPFISRSSGFVGPNQGPGLNQQPEIFYGNNTVSVPQGYVANGYTGTYLPPTSITPQRYSGVPVDTQLFLSPFTTEVPVPGQVDPTTGLPNMLTTSSPLLGVRAWTRDELDKAERLLRSDNPLSEDLLRRLRLDRRTIDQLQEDLQRGSEAQPGGSSGNDRGVLSPPGQVPLVAAPIDSAINAGAGARPTQGLTSRLLGPLAAQSEQYERLQKTLDRFYGVPETVKSDEDRNRDLRTQLAKLQQDKSNTKNGIGRLPSLPGANNTRSQIASELLVRPPQPGARPQPLKIASLATGVTAQGLKNLLTKAEQLMQQGKFMSALDQYDAASIVSPGNTMVMLGRANAELGAGLYQRAAADLQGSLSIDPVLTMAQFDLKEMMGQDRVETIVRDLKVLAQKQDTDATPALLLAYIAYNTGYEAQAGVYLDLAQNRAGDNDAFIKLLQTHWSLPARAPEVNAPPTTQPIR